MKNFKDKEDSNDETYRSNDICSCDSESAGENIALQTLNLIKKRQIK